MIINIIDCVSQRVVHLLILYMIGKDCKKIVMITFFSNELYEILSLFIISITIKLKIYDIKFINAIETN